MTGKENVICMYTEESEREIAAHSRQLLSIIIEALEIQLNKMVQPKKDTEAPHQHTGGVWAQMALAKISMEAK